LIKKILVAFDNGKKSQKALETAIEIAGNGKAEIFIATSVKMPDVVTNYVMSRDILNNLEDETKKYFQNILDEASAKVKEKNIPVQTIILYDSPGEGLVKFAGKENIDLIVMGAHNRGTVERFLMGMGSVSNYVLNHAHCLVLIARD
jgi:nucleotide-binding universal stress UspA family protein